MLGKTVWVIPALSKGKPIGGIAFAEGPGCTWWVMRKDGEVRCVHQGDLILGQNSQWFELYDVQIQQYEESLFSYGPVSQL